MSTRTRFEGEAKGSSEMAFLETNGAPYMSTFDALSKSPRNKLRNSRRSWKCTSTIEVEKKIMINQSIFGSYSIQSIYRFFEGHKNVKESKGIIVVRERGLEVNKHCIHIYHITLNSPSSIFSY